MTDGQYNKTTFLENVQEDEDMKDEEWTSRRVFKSAERSFRLTKNGFNHQNSESPTKNESPGKKSISHEERRGVS